MGEDGQLEWVEEGAKAYTELSRACEGKGPLSLLQTKKYQPADTSAQQF